MGKVISFELNSQDPEKAVLFYSSVFGWEVSEPKWEYALTKTGGIDGGIVRGPSDFPHGTRIHIQVDSIDETIMKVEQVGARIVRQKMEFDNFYLAYLMDPTGIGLGVIEYK